MSGLEPGQTVVLRYFMFGRPSGAMPTRLVTSEPGPVLWLAPETLVLWAAVEGRPLRDVPPEERDPSTVGVAEQAWSGDGVTIIGRPGRAHSLWLFREEGEFAGWYVNLEDPWRPSRLGFDTADHELDVWVGSDGSWHWKDEHDLEVAVARGFFSAEQAAAIRAEGERVIAEWPFPTGWEDWHPDPTWSIPAVPADWRE